MDGLDNVVVTETVLSDVDGENGRLIIKGHSLEELAGRTRYEDVAYLLLDGLFDDLPPQGQFRRRLGEARALAFLEVAALDPAQARRPR